MGRIRSIRQTVEKLARSRTDAPFPIPQEDGSVAEFTKEQVAQGYIALYEGVIDGVPVDHPHIAALRTTSDPRLSECYSDLLDDVNFDHPAEDLSANPKESPY